MKVGLKDESGTFKDESGIDPIMPLFVCCAVIVPDAD